jgi:hypothetical protein
MKVIVTGSRLWRDGALIRAQLNTCLNEMPIGDRLIVIHGACRSGADQYADAWARWHVRHDMPVSLETHPARWEDPCRISCRPGHRRQDPRGWDVCPQAGFYRNEHMVRQGADLCLAFIADQSKGATHCATYAGRAGIPVRRFNDTAEAVTPALF